MIVIDRHEEVGRWIEERGAGFYRPGGKCIGLVSEGKLVAGVLYDYCNGASVYAHVAIEGMLTRHFLYACFSYPFNQLGVKVIIGLVPESNKRARKFDEHLGFKLTARIPDGHPEGGLLIYTLRRKDLPEWIWGSHEQTKSTCSAAN